MLLSSAALQGFGRCTGRSVGLPRHVLQLLQFAFDSQVGEQVLLAGRCRRASELRFGLRRRLLFLDEGRLTLTATSLVLLQARLRLVQQLGFERLAGSNLSIFVHGRGRVTELDRLLFAGRHVF